MKERPLALARAAARATTGSPNPAFLRRGHGDHQAYVQAAWLDDLSGDARWLSAQCQHQSLSVPLVWLREPGGGWNVQAGHHAGRAA